MGIYLGKPNT
jgi:serine/threonine protein phosphatase PrpC